MRWAARGSLLGWALFGALLALLPHLSFAWTASLLVAVSFSILLAGHIAAFAVRATRRRSNVTASQSRSFAFRFHALAKAIVDALNIAYEPTPGAADRASQPAATRKRGRRARTLDPNCKLTDWTLNAPFFVPWCDPGTCPPLYDENDEEWTGKCRYVMRVGKRGQVVGERSCACDYEKRSETSCREIGSPSTGNYGCDASKCPSELWTKPSGERGRRRVFLECWRVETRSQGPFPNPMLDCICTQMVV